MEEITLALSADDMVICVKTLRNRHESSNRWVQQGHRIEDQCTKSSVFLYTISEHRVTGIKIQYLSQLPKNILRCKSNKTCKTCLLKSTKCG